MGIKNPLINENEKSWDHYSRMRIIIQLMGQEVGSMLIYRGFEDENLHSVNGIRSLVVYQSFEVSRMRIFILLTVSGAWEYTNFLRFQG